jgi:type II secretory pathway pseudopilin PulG
VSSEVQKSKKRSAFTIIELLTVMSVIILLMGLLVPALNMVKRYAKRVMQKNQFHTIEVAMDIYNAEWEEYPSSQADDPVGNPYCGAMRLAEAMVGQDLAGFNPVSKFRSDGTLDGPGTGTDLYGPLAKDDRSARRQYLKPESANAHRLQDIYSDIGSYDPVDDENRVLCDAYSQVTHKVTGKLVGMPVLYYRADASRTMHDPTAWGSSQNIYVFLDNYAFVQLDVPWDAQETHPLGAVPSGPPLFYEKTLNPNITVEGGRPYRADSYILWSAGFDGLYGNDDDVLNFGH